MQQVVVLQRQRQALPDVLAEPRVDRRGVAAPQHQVHPPLGQVLQHRVLLRDTDRVVRGDQVVAVVTISFLVVAAMNASSVVGRGREERRVVVLADREHVQPDFLGLLRDPYDRVNPVGLASRVPRHRIPGDVADGKDPEIA